MTLLSGDCSLFTAGCNNSTYFDSVTPCFSFDFVTLTGCYCATVAESLLALSLGVFFARGLKALLRDWDLSDLTLWPDLPLGTSSAFIDWSVIGGMYFGV